MRVLVTGGLGQIGSHVAEDLLERGDDVLVIDNLATGRELHLKSHPNLRIVLGGIEDDDLVRKTFIEFEPQSVVHAAASYMDPDNWANDIATNVTGTSNLVLAARRTGVKRFVYLQTSLCYGLRPLEQPISLSHPRVPEGSSYAISKTAAELYIELSGISQVTFRLANVVGPRNLAGPLPIFYRRLTRGQACFVSESRRDFVFVKDLSFHILKALDGIGEGAYHFSSGEDVPIRYLYDAVVHKLGITGASEPESIPVSADDVGSILLDPSRTVRDFGAFSHTPLKDIVSQAIDYYEEYGVEREVTHLRVGH